MSNDESLIRDLIQFHHDTGGDLPEKASLYLSGISALAIGFMKETNATNFEVSSDLNVKADGKKYKAIFTITEIKS